jgi:hypothetical protein
MTRNCDLKRSIRPWVFAQKPRRSRRFSNFVSTKDKIDPALLGQMDKKLDTTIHLLQSLL